MTVFVGFFFGSAPTGGGFRENGFGMLFDRKIKTVNNRLRSVPDDRYKGRKVDFIDVVVNNGTVVFVFEQGVGYLH